MTAPQPQVDLELDEGEVVVYVGRRHWIELLQTSAIFLVIGIISALIAIFRAAGGTFLIMREGITRPLTDPINIALILVAVVLIGLWARGEAKKQRNGRPWSDPDLLYLLAVAVIGLAVWFRASGGELITIDPVYSRAGDPINITLSITTLLMFAAVLYLYNDWRDDFLVVTNTRVVYDDETLFIRHVQQQVLLDDIQQVFLRMDTYQATLFGYGKLIIRSFSPRRLEFDFAAKPREIEAAIMDQVRNLRRRQAPDLLRNLIEDQVYGNKLPVQAGPAVQVRTQHGFIPGFFPPNPEVAGDRITWRPSWIYVMIQIFRPLSGFLLTVIALVILLQFGWINGIIASIIFFAGLLVFGAWGWWIREALIHDTYILTRNDIIDVDRRPFGPENTRRAQLSAIQNISFDVSFVERLLGLGTVIVETGGATGGNFTFAHVPDPRGVQATINDYLTDFRKHEKERQLQDALALLKQYDLVQREHGEKLTRDQFDGAVADVMSRTVKQSADNDLTEYINGTVSTQVDAHFRRLARQSLRRDMLRVLRERMRRRRSEPAS